MKARKTRFYSKKRKEKPYSVIGQLLHEIIASPKLYHLNATRASDWYRDSLAFDTKNEALLMYDLLSSIA